MWETGEVHTETWWGGPGRKRPLERPRRRCEGNIKMDFHEVGWGLD